MKLHSDQTDSNSLSVLGAEVVRLIKTANYQELATRFGYALAFGQEPSAVMEQEIAMCLSEEGRCATIDDAANPDISVQYFKPNDSNLFALVKCFLPLLQDPGEILVELIVTSEGRESHVCVEQISYASRIGWAEPAKPNTSNVSK